MPCSFPKNLMSSPEIVLRLVENWFSGRWCAWRVDTLGSQEVLTVTVITGCSAVLWETGPWSFACIPFLLKEAYQNTWDVSLVKVPMNPL